MISYSIRIHRGRGQDRRQFKPWTATFEVAPTCTEKSARKKAEAFAAAFERDCKAGLIGDGRRRFDDYCNDCIGLKEQCGIKHSTIFRYRELTKRFFPAIGHIKICDLRADHLNALYTELMKPKAEKPDVKYFQANEISKIRGALELKPIKWKTLVHMLLITGARRGEIPGMAE